MANKTASIRYVEDKNGDVFFPVTHQRGVVDSDGNNLETALASKQDTLVSGTSIKTINGSSILGSGNIEVQTSITTDSTPTSGSTNPVESGGVYTALQGKQTSISTVNVSVDSNTGTPSATASVSGDTMSISFSNLKGGKGDTGATPEFSVGTVSTLPEGSQATVSITGTTDSPVLNIGIPTGATGAQGNTGSSVDYPYELVNNVTTDDATKGLSAAQGVTLKGQIDQLGLKVSEIIPEISYKQMDLSIVNGNESSSTTRVISSFILFDQSERLAVASGYYIRKICIYNLDGSFVSGQLLPTTQNYYDLVSDGTPKLFRVSIMNATDTTMQITDPFNFTITKGTMVSVTNTQASGKEIAKINNAPIYIPTIDSAPTSGNNNNLVSSGGVATAIGAVNDAVSDMVEELGMPERTVAFTSADYSGMLWDGTKIISANGTYDAFVLPVSPGMTLETSGSPSLVSSGVTFSSYPSIGMSSAIRTNLASYGTYTIQEGENYVLFTIIKANLGSMTCKCSATGLFATIASISESSAPLAGKKILCLGDSLTERKGTNGKGYVEYLAEITGATVTRCAMGGALYCRRTGSNNPLTTTPTNSAQARAPFDVVCLVEAIKDQDYQYIDAGAAWLLANESLDYSDLVTTIKGVDLSEYDIVTVFAGTNDFAAGNTMGNADSTMYGQVNGAINKILDALFTANPALRVFFFTPVIRYLNNTVSDANWGDVWQNSQNLTLRQFADAIVSQMVYNHIPVCDFYDTLGWDKRNFSHYFNTVAPNIDTTHPTYVGFESIAKRMSAYLTANLY